MDNTDPDGKEPNDHTQNSCSQEKLIVSMLNQYECLVSDLTEEVDRCYSSLKESTHEINRAGGGGLRQDELQRKEQLISNLTSQVDILSRSKEILNELWLSAIGHVELLESRESNKSSRLEILPENFLSKWNVCQTYVKSLEERLEKKIGEVQFYRNKIMELRVEFDVLSKKHSAEKLKCVEQAKEAYIKEIEHLKTSKETMRQEHLAHLEKRLQEERQSWDYEETQRLQLVKVKVQEVLVENKALEERERHLMIAVAALEAEVLQLRSQIALFSKVGVEPCERVLVSRAGHLGIGSGDASYPEAVKSDNCNLRTPLSEPRKDFRDSVCQTYEYNPELTGNNEFEDMKTSVTHLQNENALQRVKLQKKHEEMQELSCRYERRIQELEKLNTNSRAELQTMREKWETLCEKSQVDTSTQTQDNQSNRFMSNELLTLEKDVESRKKHVQILYLQKQIDSMSRDRANMMEIIERQRGIIAKWKWEYKQLAKKTLSSGELDEGLE